jgi:phage tail sheath protein FI
MPVPLTYPGVYIEEIPSGVRTITGVATSITAFIGRALRGPVNDPVTINSLADFERIFGGLWVDSSLGYAVRDFYLNGGSQAIIVRIFNPVDEAATAANDLANNLLTLVPAPEPANDQLSLTSDQVTSVTNALNSATQGGSSENLTQVKKIKDSILPITTTTTKVSDFRAAVTAAKSAVGQTKAHFKVTGLSSTANTDLDKAKSAVTAAKAAIQDLKDSDKLKQADVTKVTLALSTAPNDIKNDSNVTAKNAIDGLAGDLKDAINNSFEKFVTDTVNTDINSNAHVLKLKAASEGSWGMNLRARVTHPDAKTAKEIADNLGVDPTDIFNLSIQDSATGVIESFRNVTVKDSIQRVDKVLKNGSNLVEFDGDITQVASASRVRPDAHSSPEPGKGVWDENIPQHTLHTALQPRWRRVDTFTDRLWGLPRCSGVLCKSARNAHSRLAGRLEHK